MKKRNNLLLENSFFSDYYFNKIFSEKDKYLNNFINLFFHYNPLIFTNNDEKIKIINTINKELPDYKKKVLSSADLIIKNKFSVFGKSYQFPRKVNWFYSFFNNFVWPFKRSKNIDWILDIEKDIDIKFATRLNQHKDFVILGLAFFLTRDEKYSIKFLELILDWINKNPPNWGINWTDFLEVSHRLTSWIFALSLFKDSNSLKSEYIKVISKSLYQHAFFIRINSQKKAYNHTIGEQFSLFLFSKIFKEIPSINKWYKDSYYLLLKQIKRQTQEDGVNIEQSVNYHRLVLEIFSLFLLNAPELIPQEELKIIEKKYEFWKYIIKPDGSIPQVGDSDDAHFIPPILFSSEKNINQELLNLGSILFKRPDFKLKYNDDETPLILLLMGNKAFNSYKNIKYSPSKDCIKYFEYSGYFIAKSDWSNKSNYLFFDMGQFGPYPSAHDHSDISNIIYSYKGRPILIDSGTYMYNIPLEKRNFFRSSIAHNILTINYQDQGKINDWFSWKNKPKIRRTVVINDNDEIELYCIHNGHSGFLVERKIFTNRHLNELIIKDKVISLDPKKEENSQKIDILFHCDKAYDPIAQNNNIFISNELYLKVSSNQEFKINIKKSKYSPRYGFKFENYIINVHLEPNFKKSKLIEVETRIIPIN